MAIFARSTLQRMINENNTLLSKANLRCAVEDLNSSEPNRVLKEEWETIWLNAFSKVGTIFHEPEMTGRCRPDIHFLLEGKDTVEFVADVTTVSDRDLHAANPIDDFVTTFQSFIRKSQLRIESFSIEVEGVYGNENIGKKRLLLPAQHNFVDQYRFIKLAVA